MGFRIIKNDFDKKIVSQKKGICLRTTNIINLRNRWYPEGQGCLTAARLRTRKPAVLIMRAFLLQLIQNIRYHISISHYVGRFKA